MKKYFLILLLFIGCNVQAQHKTNKKDTGFVNIDLDKLKRQIDSSNKMMESSSNNALKQMRELDMKRFEEQNNRNLDAFMQMQKEREAKQKKAMWIRLGFGVALLAVFVFVLIRRRKRQAQ